MKSTITSICIAIFSLTAGVGALITLTSCGEAEAAAGGQFTPQQLADSLNVVLKSDRKVYARDIKTNHTIVV